MNPQKSLSEEIKKNDLNSRKTLTIFLEYVLL